MTESPPRRSLSAGAADLSLTARTQGFRMQWLLKDMGPKVTAELVTFVPRVSPDAPAAALAQHLPQAVSRGRGVEQKHRDVCLLGDGGGGSLEIRPARAACISGPEPGPGTDSRWGKSGSRVSFLPPLPQMPGVTTKGTVGCRHRHHSCGADTAHHDSLTVLEATSPKARCPPGPSSLRGLWARMCPPLSLTFRGRPAILGAPWLWRLHPHLCPAVTWPSSPWVSLTASLPLFLGGHRSRWTQAWPPAV